MNYVGLSRRATRDIDGIWTYSVEQWGKAVAEDYFEAIEDALKRLRRDPGLLRSKPEVSRYFQFYRVRKHFLICTRFKAGIFVLGVIHGSMDLPARLGDLEPQLLREAETLHKAWVAKRSQGD